MVVLLKMMIDDNLLGERTMPKLSHLAILFTKWYEFCRVPFVPRMILPQG